VIAFKEALFDEAFAAFRRAPESNEYDGFCKRHAAWLEDFALFTALKKHFRGRGWDEWPGGIRDRRPEALKEAGAELREAVAREKFLQYVFSEQWSRLKRCCLRKGIQIIGDIPIYVHYDSADVWSHPELFELDEGKRPRVVAGVPPDYFSETGQLWGNPIYRWEASRAEGYDWWLRRFEHLAALCGLVRVDHFRGFVAYWEVPAGEPTAMNGRWVPGPAEDFFNHLRRRFPLPPIIAEDLGVITPDVRELIARLGVPGMKVLLFAFGGDVAANPYAPHNHVPNCVVYPGTHDNNTVRGWWDHEATPEEQERVCRYLGRAVAPEEAAGAFVRLALMSVANTAVVSMQDILGLGGEARMNTPQTVGGNWLWRLRPGQPDDASIEWLGGLTELYGRA